MFLLVISGSRILRSFSLNLVQINRDPVSSEMLKMRQQLEFLQAELCARGGGASSDEIQVTICCAPGVDVNSKPF